MAPMCKIASSRACLKDFFSFCGFFRCSERSKKFFDNQLTALIGILNLMHGCLFVLDNYRFYERDFYSLHLLFAQLVQIHSILHKFWEGSKQQMYKFISKCHSVVGNFIVFYTSSLSFWIPLQHVIRLAAKMWKIA